VMARDEALSELNERRKSERVELVVRVTYQTVDELFSEFARNINDGGIFIETENPQDVGSTIQLQFKLPGNEVPIEVTGIVVRTTDGTSAEGQPGMGIEFGDLGAEHRDRINDLIRHLRSEFPEN
jgi:type IV pilus assembly protein PilZ